MDWFGGSLRLVWKDGRVSEHTRHGSSLADAEKYVKENEGELLEAVYHPYPLNLLQE